MNFLNSSKHNYSSELIKKTDNYLVAQAYSQLYIGLITAQTGATIIFLGLYHIHYTTNFLFIWYGLVSILTLSRIFLVKKYFSQKNPEKNISLWLGLFVLGSALGGLCWGMSSILLFYTTNHIQQAVVILTIAAVTSGSVATVSAIRLASLVFLTIAILPFTIEFFILSDFTLSWSNSIFIIYWAYLIILSFRMHAMIKNLIYLNLENSALLKSLSIANKNLSHLATHDALTEIDNRRLFYINLKNAIRRAKRNNELLAVLYIDLDKFKDVNDKYGHDIGDKLLILVTSKIKEAIREVDLVSRMGGDEFTVILERVESVQNAGKIASSICHLLSLPMNIQGYIISITASIGISFYPLNGADSETLIKAADHAMYYVKKYGHNNFHFSER